MDAASEPAAAIAETGRLFLRNLSYAATEADLEQLLSPYGDLSEVHLVVDKCAVLPRWTNVLLYLVCCRRVRLRSVGRHHDACACGPSLGHSHDIYVM